ncbi:hypothetical protein RhiirA4_417498 [Rhizophagus irregularis]|uniref:Uncharacterized protein n=1 Tax=Rhizophagus irregularis TaxID=588596 RepID=A0A2I1G762_9GLOM|nr:hypothetical protein RhiirA4_417498 [Rhizophagus irregularis]
MTGFLKESVTVLKMGKRMMIMMIYINNLKGYICRVQSSKPMEVLDKEENFSFILKILASVLNMKKIWDYVHQPSIHLISNTLNEILDRNLLVILEFGGLSTSELIFFLYYMFWMGPLLADNYWNSEVPKKKII